MNAATQYVILLLISVAVALGNAFILVFFRNKLKKLMEGIK